MLSNPLRPKSADEESCEKQIAYPPFFRYRTKDFGISSEEDSTSPRRCAPDRYFLVTIETVEVSASKMPMMSRSLMFLLLPTCKYIVRFAKNPEKDFSSFQSP